MLKNTSISTGGTEISEYGDDFQELMIKVDNFIFRMSFF